MEKFKKFCTTFSKSIFAVICYIITFLLAILSAFFTVKFYTDGLADNFLLAMGFLAGGLEFIKIMLSTSLPFMKGKDRKKEFRVKIILNICLVLSILASIYFFLNVSDVTMSPAAKVTELVYKYVPTLTDIVPLAVTQFFTTFSLSILIEYLIIFLPQLAPIMFKTGNEIESVLLTRFEKIKRIIAYYPNRFIDNLYNRVFNTSIEEEKNVNVIEVNKSLIKEVDNEKTYVDLEQYKTVNKEKEVTNVNDNKIVKEDDKKIISLDKHKLNGKIDNNSEKFVDYMYANSNNDYMVGVRQICKNIDIPESQGLKIKDMLVDKRIIEKVGTKFRILNKDIKEVKEKLVM